MWSILVGEEEGREERRGQGGSNGFVGWDCKTYDSCVFYVSCILCLQGHCILAFVKMLDNLYRERERETRMN